MSLLAGCSSSSPETSIDPSAIAKIAAHSPTASRSALQVDKPEHDFGPILAQGQTLRHSFKLTNPTNRPVKLIASEALTPCCSTIGPLPDSVPPGGSIEVPIEFRPGHQSGHRRVEFAIQTDDSHRSPIGLAVWAELIPDLELIEVENEGHTVPMEATGQRVYRVVCRQLGEEGRAAPSSVEAIEPLSARFRNPPVHSTRPDGLVESHREIEVTLPPSSEAKTQRGEFLLRWSEEQTWRQTLSWEVTPHIRASPSGLVIPSNSQSTKTIELRSENRPFRVTGITGNLLANPMKPPTVEPQQHHELQLVLDPSRATGGSVSEILITTDHPDQASVSLNVLLLPSEDNGGTE